VEAAAGAGADAGAGLEGGGADGVDGAGPGLLAGAEAGAVVVCALPFAAFAGDAPLVVAVRAWA
jgi:hypothetical protein